MEVVEMESLATMTDSELRQLLEKHEISAGPITDTTRKIYVKKLMNLVKPSNGSKKRGSLAPTLPIPGLGSNQSKARKRKLSSPTKVSPNEFESSSTHRKRWRANPASADDFERASSSSSSSCSDASSFDERESGVRPGSLRNVKIPVSKTSRASADRMSLNRKQPTYSSSARQKFDSTDDYENMPKANMARMLAAAAKILSESEESSRAVEVDDDYDDDLHASIASSSGLNTSRETGLFDVPTIPQCSEQLREEHFREVSAKVQEFIAKAWQPEGLLKRMEVGARAHPKPDILQMRLHANRALDASCENESLFSATVALLNSVGPLTSLIEACQEGGILKKKLVNESVAVTLSCLSYVNELLLQTMHQRQYRMKNKVDRTAFEVEEPEGAYSSTSRTGPSWLNKWSNAKDDKSLFPDPQPLTSRKSRTPVSAVGRRETRRTSSKK